MSQSLTYFPQLSMELSLECPQCRKPMRPPPVSAPERNREGPVIIVCPGCDSNYSVWQDVVDLRQHDSSYSDRDEEIETFWRLLEWSREYEIVGLVCKFIHETMNVPVHIKDLYIQNRLNSVARGRDVLDLFDWLSDKAGFQGDAGASSDKKWLGDLMDIGTGSGGQLVAAKDRTNRLIGMDASMTELGFARRLFLDHGLTDRVDLFGANAEHLPLADESLDTILMRDVVEHLTDQQAGLQEIWRTLRPGGRFYLNSPNRYAAWWPEPHTMLYWLGFMPRTWMSPYTQWRIGMPYMCTRLLGLRELNGMLRSLNPRPSKVLVVATAPPGTTNVPNIGPLGRLPLLTRIILSRKANNLPLIRHFTPEHQILLIK